MTRGWGPQAQMCDPGKEIASTRARSVLLRVRLSTQLQSPYRLEREGCRIVSEHACLSSWSFGFIFEDRLLLCLGKNSDKTLS